MINIDFDKTFDYENNFYLTSSVSRISKFATHLELFRKTSGLPGDIVECGVFKGCSLSRLIKFRSLFENPFSRKIIAFDTFGDFPKAQYSPDVKARDEFIRAAGDKSIEKEELIRLLLKLNLYQNVELIKGDILNTVPKYKSENPHLKISLLHVDVDLYEATKMCLEEFYPLVVNGGIIVLDDYNRFAGANKAIDDFFKEKEAKVQKLSYSDKITFVEVGRKNDNCFVDGKKGEQGVPGKKFA